MQSPLPPPNLEVIRETVQELYGPGLRQVSRPKFDKPYPKAIDRENPYPREYRIPEFSLFFGACGEGFHGWQHLPIVAENKKNHNKNPSKEPL